MFFGSIGSSAPLSSLTTDALGMVLVDGGAITTTGTQTFHEMVSLLRSTTLTASTVNFDDAVMTSGSLTVAGATHVNGGSINSTLAQSYNGAVTLGANTTLSSSNAGAITFAGTLNGAFDLVINTTGNTTFNGAVGASTPLTRLHTNAGGHVMLNAPTVTTTGAQTYDEAVTLGVNTLLTSTGAAAINFAQAIDGAHDLSVATSGMTTLGGSVNVASVAISGASTQTGGTVSTTQAQTYGGVITLGANTTLSSSLNTIQFNSISDGVGSYNLDLQSHTAQVLGPIDIGGHLHVTTDAGGVSQRANSSILIGGTATFTANTGINQVAALTDANNTFSGLLTLNQTNQGSWADVAVTTASALTLAPLQSAGTVDLQTQGALTTGSITTSGSLLVNSHGGNVSLGEATVTANMTVQSAGGNVSQTGPFTVAGNSSVTAGTGTITLNYESIDQTVTPPRYISNSFGGTLALSGDSTAVATTGNLQLGSVTNTGPMTLRAPSGSVDLGNAFITGGSLTLVSRDDMNLGGANISGNLQMTSTAGNVSFGSASVAGDLTANTQGGVVDLGNAIVGRNLNVQTQGGNIVQSAAIGSALTVSGTSRLDAGTGNITLPNIPNRFANAMTLQANNVELVATNGLILANSNVSGTMDVTAATGSITQTGVLNVTGVSTFHATSGDVMLSQANTFAQPVAVDAINATLNSATALVLGPSTLTGDLKANIAQGDVTQVGPLTVGGKTNLTTTQGNVTLTDVSNSFTGTVSAKTSGTLSLTSSGPLSLGEVITVSDTLLNSAGKLDLGTSTFGAKITANSGGFDIIQSGPIKVGGNSNFNAGSAKIDLFNPKNTWSGSILYKGGIVMINHPQLMNAVNAGTLVVRTETAISPTTAKASASSTPTSQATAASAVQGSDVSVSVSRPASANQTGLVTVTVSAEAASTGKGFAFTLTEHLPAEAPKTAQVAVTQLDGRPLPEWLRYDAQTQKVVATAPPPGAFPIQIKANVGGVETVIVITEQPK
jgi:hypothetical protein